jgi:hypothetical protein
LPWFDASMTNPQPWWFAWPVTEVAAAILPLFSYPPLSPYVTEMGALRHIVAWCRTGTPPGSLSLRDRRRQDGENQFDDPDIRAVAEATHVLERAGLLMRALQTISPGGSGGYSQGYSYFYLGLTRLGWHALQTKSVRQHLGLGDAPPTA